jgi:hypothetical protein
MKAQKRLTLRNSVSAALLAIFTAGYVFPWAPAMAVDSCWDMPYHPGWVSVCGCDDDVQKCLPVWQVTKYGHLACVDDGETFYGYCTNITAVTVVGSKVACAPTINSIGRTACEIAIGLETLNIVGNLIDPESAKGWLATLAGLIIVPLVCSYCHLVTCVPGGEPVQIYRHVVPPTGLDAYNQPLYDYPVCPE